MRTRVSSGSPYEGEIGFSRAVRVGDRIIVAGTAPIGPDGNTVGIGEPRRQARRCLEIITAAIRELGGTAGDVVRTRTFLVQASDWREVGLAHGEFFEDVRPASTMVVCGGLLDPEWLVEIEAEAIVGSAETA